MATRIYLSALVILFLLMLAPGAFALEKLKLSTPVKMAPPSYLLPLAAEEKGFWKENGLEVEWVPFAGSTPQMHAVAAGAVSIGTSPSTQILVMTARGVPLVMVGELIPDSHFALFVRGDSPYRHVRDLKGKRIAVTGLGSPTHAYGQIIARAHGLEKDVRFVGAGEPTVMIAGLKTGAFEAMVNSLFAAIGGKVEGAFREIAPVSDYLPKPWVENVVFARKDFARSKPDLMRKLLKATVQAADFMRKNPRWTIDKMKSFQGLSEEAAKLVNDQLQFTVTGRLEFKAVENMRRLYIEYGIVTEKAPAAAELFTNDYLP